MAKRLKILLGFSLVLFIVVELLSVLLVALVGQTNGLIFTVILGILIAGIVGFKAEQSLIKSMVAQTGGYSKGGYLANGFSVAIIYGILSSVLLYFTTGKFNYNSGGLGVIVATIVGAYLAEKRFLSSAPQTQISAPPVKVNSTKTVVFAFLGTILLIALLTIVILMVQSHLKPSS